MSVIEIKRKPTARQVEALRTGTTNPEGIIEVTADKRTHEGLVGRGLADWKRPETLGLGRSVHGTALCVINSQGVTTSPSWTVWRSPATTWPRASGSRWPTSGSASAAGRPSRPRLRGVEG